MSDEAERILTQYRDPAISAEGYRAWPALPPMPYKGPEARPYKRPGEEAVEQVLANYLSPTMGAHAMGQLGADTYLKAMDKDISGALANVPLLAVSAMSFPGMKGKMPQKTAAAPDVAERVVGAAIKVGDKIVGKGRTHFDALVDAVPGARERGLFDDALVKAFEDLHGGMFDADGFVTNQGRYVTREEALSLAKGEGYKPSLLSRIFMGDSLDAEAFGKFRDKRDAADRPGSADEGRAEGGSVKDAYDDPAISAEGYRAWPALPPMLYKGPEARPYKRPGEDAVEQVLANYLSPTMGAYSMGQLGADTYLKAKDKDISGALANVPLLAAAALPLPGMKGKMPPLARELDSLGFYSQALEAAKNLQRKAGPAQGWLNDLQKAGVKKAEIEATKLGEFFAANPNPTRDELVQHLRDNRVQVREKWYGDTEAMLPGDQKSRPDEKAIAEMYVMRGMTPDQAAIMASRAGDELTNRGGDIKWKHHGGQNLLLDPENPTNRESVVHLGPAKRAQEIEAQMKANQPRLGETLTAAKELAKKDGFDVDGPFKMEAYFDAGLPGSQQARALRDQHIEIADQQKALLAELKQITGDTYKEPHFPNVPNYLFHLRTGQYKDTQGRKVGHIDEAQSTRAQAIRDSEAGPRDEAKIAELQRRYDDQVAKADAYILGEPAQFVHEMLPRLDGSMNLGHARPDRVPDVTAVLAELDAQNYGPILDDAGLAKVRGYRAEIEKLVEPMNLYDAELRAAKQAPSGHPLVNDMSQTNLTMLRRAIQHFADSGVEGITLTPGDLQNQRYSLSNHVSDLNLSNVKVDGRSAFKGDAVRTLRATGRDGRTVTRPVSNEAELAEIVGRDWARELWNAPMTPQGIYSRYESVPGAMGVHRELGENHVEIGGHGMREYYDRQYPAVLEKELKRLDPQWPGRQSTNLLTEEGLHTTPSWEGPKHIQERIDAPTPFHYFPLTPKVREEVKKGLPLFSIPAAAAPMAGTILDQYYPTQDPNQQ